MYYFERSLAIRLRISLLFFSAAFLSALARPIRADDEATPHAIIDRALAAGGGAEKIAQFKAMSFKGELTAAGADKKMKVSGLFGGPTLFTMKLATIKDGPTAITAGGDTFWAKTGKEELKEYHAGNDKITFENVVRMFYAVSLPDQLLVLKSKPFKLTIVGDQAVNGVQAVAVRVNHELQGEAMLYFAKETGLPVKSQVKLLPQKDGGKGLFGDSASELAEVFFDDYKKFSGVKHFTRVKLRLGDDVIELKLREIKLLKKVDAGAFKKPR